jgi:hypothetical protein
MLLLDETITYVKWLSAKDMNGQQLKDIISSSNSAKHYFNPRWNQIKSSFYYDNYRKPACSKRNTTVLFRILFITDW